MDIEFPDFNKPTTEMSRIRLKKSLLFDTPPDDNQEEADTQRGRIFSPTTLHGAIKEGTGAGVAAAYTKKEASPPR